MPPSYLLFDAIGYAFFEDDGGGYNIYNICRHNFEAISKLYMKICKKNLYIVHKELLLTLASYDGYLPLVKKICETNPSILEYFDVDYAVIGNSRSIVEYLCKNGARIDHDNMIQAIENDNIEIVKILHETGIDITAENNSLICRAVYYGHFEIVKYLHENGVDITAQNNKLIYEAKKYGYDEIINYLLKNGAAFTPPQFNAPESRK
jgi:hypothetical protein